MLEHSFNGPPFTIGIEEELMLLDADSLDLANEIEAVLAAVPAELEGQVKPELLQSVLEVATTPCEDVRSAGEQLRVLRRSVAEIAERRGLLVAASGTHPFASGRTSGSSIGPVTGSWSTSSATSPSGS